jgi:hypothetical protein
MQHVVLTTLLSLFQYIIANLQKKIRENKYSS